MPTLFDGLDFWTVCQATALVAAVFGVAIVARACWDATGLPELRDGFLELVTRRAGELRGATVPSRAGYGAAPFRAGPLARRIAGSVADPRFSLRRREDEWIRRAERTRRSRPDAVQRRRAAESLAALLKRPAPVAGQDPAVRSALDTLEPAVRSAGTLAELAAVLPLYRRTAGILLRGSALRRFAGAFLPAMGRYLDFVGRGSALGLAAGVLLSGGLTAESTLVGILTSICGIGGAIIFTATVIRCDARSWPAPGGRLSPALRRGYPEAAFLLRLALTVSVLLIALAILRR